MKKAALFFSALILAVCLGYGLVRLFEIRFAQGDVYPPYSTFRTDGLGAKALHDSLAELMHVERNYRPLSDIRPAGNDSTIFVLGVSFKFEEGSYVTNLATLAREGNRVVVGFLPYQSKPAPEPTPPPEEKPAHHTKKDADKEEEEKEKIEVRKKWGVKTAFAKEPFVHAISEIPGLEPKLSWHSALYFSELDPAWRTLYSSGGKPVIIERALGKGSVVLVADAYFSSNEALSKERAPALTVALVGKSATVIFDETHLGVSEDPGVAALIRKYRLHGVVVALMCVAALFVWRNAVSFVPPEAKDTASRDVVMGTGAAAGFVSLLKRNIPFNKLMETCLAEWKRSFGHRAKPAVLARVEAAAGSGAKQPVQAFQMIMQILNEKK